MCITASISNVLVVLIVILIADQILISSCLCNSPIRVLYDSSNHLHRDKQYHPEQPSRIDACVDAIIKHKTELDNGGLRSEFLELIDVAPMSSSKRQRPKEKDPILCIPFTEEELQHARDILTQTHTDGYVIKLEQRCRSSRQRRIDEGKDTLGFIGYVDEGDTFVTTESYDVCLRATAAWIRAVNESLGIGGATKTAATTISLALTRPPGHHATKTLSNGFCLFNFAAAAAVHAMSINPNLKVSVLDWDVHYGQGVADILSSYPRARYVSVHQTPAFPYEGEKRMVRGEHRNILTVPIPPDSTWTCGYREIFETIALPFVCNSDDLGNDDGWEPDLVIVCAGYDALDSDELASCSLTAKNFGEMTRMLKEKVGLMQPVGDDLGTSKDGKRRPGLMLGLEGGYQLKDGAAGGNLADAILETIKAL